MNKEIELRQWIKDKKTDRMFRYMCYASISFGLQRYNMHRMYKQLNEIDSGVYQKLKPMDHIVSGWADDIVRMFGDCFPDFREKFSKGMSVGDIEEIICSELRILNI